MNKVICDVCGTAYPETANRCPICGSAKVASQGAAMDADQMETTAHTYAKGGHFSKKNVKARTGKGRGAESPRQEPNSEEKSGKGLIAVVIVLLIAIVGVVAYIAVQFFDFDLGLDNNQGDTQASTQASTQDQTQDTGLLEVPCTNLQLSNPILEFLDVTDKWTLEVEVDPLDCTQEIVFISSDENVVTVTKTGDKAALVQPTGNGEATITVTCGEMSAECKVTCNLAGFTNPSDPSNPSEGTVPSNPVTGEFDFKFNTPYKDETTGYYDTTFNQQGYVWRAYTSDLIIDPSAITWTSDNTKVCTVENGMVTMVGPGRTLVHAQYNGKTVSCIVRCTFKVTETQPEDTTDSTSPDENQGGSQEKTYTISSTDMTLKVDGYWWLNLKDSEGNTVEVTWTASDEGYVKIEGNKLTGIKSTWGLTKRYVTVSTTYEGTTYSCIVRVSNG